MFDGYRLSFPAVRRAGEIVVHRDRDFHFTGFKVPINQDAIVGQILWAGNLVVPAPRMHFQMRSVA